MHLFRLLTLYIALTLGAIALPTLTVAGEIADIAALRTGDMKKLVFHAQPKPVSDAKFFLADNAGKATLADYKGKYILLNFWATWCAPCRKEMPMLSALQAEFGGEKFEVLTIATGRNTPAGMTKFFTEAKITNLPLHTDPKQALAREMGIFGLPISVILNPDGLEIARLRGDAEWDSDSAKAIIAALLARPADN
jgi:thiol-disulfide isomerase/thioredoxin